jgi:acetoin utilization deacetylase AcuC-like enzyme
VEGPQRVKYAYEYLKEKGYDVVEPTPASEDSLLSVHDMEYLWNLKKGLVEDSDSPAYDRIFEFASLSVGGALLASQIDGFALMRPPGHHVGRYGAALDVYTRGFCYLNNIAIAVKESNKPTLILDIDGHHGNGTQEIFLGDPNVCYVSLHQSPNYPGTGQTSEDNCINYALPPNCGSKKFFETFNKALAKIDLSKFEGVAVSAGFDTHIGDLASLGLVEQDFFETGKRIAQLGKPTYFVLEGGYICEKLAADIDMLLRGFEENH